MKQSRSMRRRLAAKVRQGDATILNTAAKWQAVLTRADDVEYMRLLEAENTTLAKEVRQLSVDLQPRLIGLPELHVQQLLISHLEHKVSALEAVRLDLEELPHDLSSVIELVKELYPDRIVFCANAVKSARAAKLNEVPSGAGVAWRLLRSMAVVLHDLYMDGVPDMARQFQARSGFELALGEGTATRQDAELMRSRLIEHEGTFLDTGAHVKYGNREPKLLRVHYGFCVHCTRIVVGHCGDHLTTAGTRRIG